MGVVGLPGAGKTEVAQEILRLNAAYVRMGDVVWKEVKSRGLEVNETNVGKIASELREQEGPAAIAKRCIPLIKRAERGRALVVVDGIRGLAEVKEFKREFGDRFLLLAVWAQERTRFKRISARGREDDVQGLEELRRKDARELGWGLGEAMALADFMLVNEGTLEELQGAVRGVLKRILEGQDV